MHRAMFAFVFAAVAFVSPAVFAQTSDVTEHGPIILEPVAMDTEYGRFSIGPSVGTLGAGLEAGLRVNDTFGFRLNGHYLNYNHSAKIDDISYDGTLGLKSAGLIADIHPFGGGFRVSAGVRLNMNEVDLTANPSGNIEIGDAVYTPGEVGTMNGSIDFNQFSPYIGVGYEGTPFDTPNFVLGFEAGAMYHGSPSVKLSATGAASNSALAADIERERAKAEDDLSKYKLYPVVMFTARYRF